LCGHAGQQAAGKGGSFAQQGAAVQLRGLRAFRAVFHRISFSEALLNTRVRAVIKSVRSYWNQWQTATSNERRVLRARIEAYNVFNHAEFNAIGTTLSLSGATNLNTTWGQFTADNAARVLSTTLRFEF
jgi:hypothetical protein